MRVYTDAAINVVNDVPSDLCVALVAGFSEYVLCSRWSGYRRDARLSGYPQNFSRLGVIFFYKSFAVFKNNYSALGPRVILLSFAGLRCLIMIRSYYQLGRWSDFAGLIKVHYIRATGEGSASPSRIM